MTRTPTHLRGFKTIQGAKVRFDEDDKFWNFFEFKPTDAAGLSLRTSIAKDSRIYFIKLSPTELGILGIEPRADQDSFLKSVRIKTKRRD